MMNPVYLFSKTMITILIHFPFRTKLIHRNRIPKKGGFIIAHNHSSKIDPLHMMGFMDRYVHWLAKQELFETRAGRWFHLNNQEIPVNRQAGDNTGAVMAAVAKLKEGGIVGIFPEGTTKKPGGRRLLKPHTGVARMALLAEVPVVPIAISGNQDPFRKKSEKRGLEQQILVVGKPMWFKKYYGQDEDREVVQKIADEIMTEVDKLIDEGDTIRLGKPVNNAGMGWQERKKTRGPLPDYYEEDDEDEKGKEEKLAASKMQRSSEQSSEKKRKEKGKKKGSKKKGKGKR